MSAAPGALLAVVRGPAGLGLADGERAWAVPAAGPAAAARVLADLERERSPRWVWWSAREVLGPLAGHGGRDDRPPHLARAWDVAAVHRLVAGGGDDGPAAARAVACGLAPSAAPSPGQLDLGGDGGVPDGDGDDPVRPDGHLRPEWVDGSWADTPGRAARWAAAALGTAGLQRERLVATAGEHAVVTAWSESAAAVLAVELEASGVPFDVAAARRAVEAVVGPLPEDEAGAARSRAARDAPLQRLLGPGPTGAPVDLRSPAQVLDALARAGLDLPDTRSWRLERLAEEPGAPAVLRSLVAWRQAERLAVAHGPRWLAEHVAGGRLRAAWSASDGGAGRMTASAGVHSIPRELRDAVRAEPGHLLVRADLGQVEPRVLAVVSGDPALARDAAEDDLYAPVAARLRVARDVAKVAVLAAMYGQTSGAAGATMAAMERSYPRAVAMLVDAARRGAAGEDVRTAGGRLVRVPAVEEVPVEAGPAALERYRARLAGRGRFARNAVVQGSAAELFKAWAATVRARLAADGSGAVVLCLHDELLLHVREEDADAVAAGVVADLGTSAARWCRAVGGPPVRFTADVAVVDRWSRAKG
ncbi:DNA polymerase [Pseudokineococcus lusitanus]|uniref:DNA-directed DNA polymerase n=1 Tax=Pseudokineococcus lusitanus TaxID=763993 RepID=A0A3N1G905_9ACTN|nr:DNA polymerase [Pseudokineococcus lusitanus]ROP26638.1 DNA polymerase-1 [Pseudokineococcus lusitanus]